MRSSIVTGGVKSQGSTVRKFDPDGTLLWSIDHGATVRAVAIDSSGNVLVAGDRAADNKTTRKFGPNGGAEIWSVDHGDTVNAIAVDGSDNVITGGISSSGATTRKYTSAGSLSWSQDHGGTIRGIAIDSNNDVIEVGDISSSITIRKRDDADGSSLWTANHGAPYRAVSVDLSDNAVYAAGDGVSNVIARKYNTSGSLQVSYTPYRTNLDYNIPNAYAIIVTPDEVIFAGDHEFSSTTIGKPAGGTSHISLFSKTSNSHNDTITDFGGEVYALARDSDGDILYVGESYASNAELKKFIVDDPLEYSWFRRLGADTLAVAARAHKPSGAIAITALYPNQTSIHVKFVNPTDFDTDSYEYRVDGGSAQTATVTNGLIVASVGISAGTEYDIEIRAVNSIGNGPWSNLATITTEAVNEVDLTPLTAGVDLLPPDNVCGYYNGSFTGLDQVPHTVRRTRESWGMTLGDERISAMIADDAFNVNHTGFKDDFFKLPGWNMHLQTEDVSNDGAYGLSSPNHGNGVSSVIGGKLENGTHLIGLGAISNMKLRPICIDMPSPNEDQGYLIPEGILWAAARGCRVLNLSWEWVAQLNLLEYEDRIVAGKYLEDRGGIILGAIGNVGTFGGSYVENYPRHSSWVECGGRVNDTGQKYGQWGNATDFVAHPGSFALLSYSGGQSATGTSEVAPQFTYLVYLLLSINPLLGPADIREIMARCASNPDAPNTPYYWNTEWGFGDVDFIKALNLAYSYQAVDVRGVNWLIGRDGEDDVGGDVVFDDVNVDSELVIDGNLVKVQLVYEYPGGALSDPVYQEASYGATDLPLLTAAVELEAIITDEKVIPTNAGVTSSAISPTVVIGSVNISPSVSNSTAESIDPQVELSSMSISPALANLTADAISPIIELSDVSISPSVSDSVTSAIGPVVELGDLTVSPTFASTVSTALGAAAILGSIVFSPSLAALTTDAIDPEVDTPEGENVLVVPSPCDTITDAVNPIIVLSSTTVNPSPAIVTTTAKTGSIFGGIVDFYTPSPIEVLPEAIEPTVIISSVTITPVNAGVNSTLINPVVELGSTSITPAVASSSAEGQNPSLQVGNDVDVSPINANTITLAISPSVILGSISVDANNADVLSECVNPDVIVGSVQVNPDESDVTADAIGPSVIIGNVVITPTNANLVTSAVAPTTIQGDISLTPSISSTIAQGIDPVVVVSDVVITPAVADSFTSGIDPTLEESSTTVVPESADVVAEGRNPTVSSGSLSLSPSEASSTSTAINPQVLLTDIFVSGVIAESLVDAIEPVCQLSSTIALPNSADVTVTATITTVLQGLQLSPFVSNVQSGWVSNVNNKTWVITNARVTEG